MAALYYHVIRMNISAFLVVHYIPHFLGQILPSWSKSLFCFPRMVNTRNNPAAPEQGEASAAREESLPQPPSLAEVMLEAERNRRDTNRLLERIEQNTARQQRVNPVSTMTLSSCTRQSSTIPSNLSMRMTGSAASLTSYVLPT